MHVCEELRQMSSRRPHRERTCVSAATTPQTARIGDISRRARIRLRFSLQGPTVTVQQVLARKTVAYLSRRNPLLQR